MNTTRGIKHFKIIKQFREGFQSLKFRSFVAALSHNSLCNYMLSKCLVILFLLFGFEANAFEYSKLGNDYRDYYFKGEIDVIRYPQFNSCGYKAGLKVKFDIYDDRFFAECDGEFGWIPYAGKDGYYEFITEENISINLTSIKGKIVNLKINNPEKIKGKKKLSLQNNSCEIAEFISKFQNAYYSKEIKSSQLKNHKLYRLGEYSETEGEYMFDFWLFELFQYKDKLLSSITTTEATWSNSKGHYCFRKVLSKDADSSEERLISIKNCNGKEENISLKINECIVTKNELSNLLNKTTKNN
jgi:hypothetical protein